MWIGVCRPQLSITKEGFYEYVGRIGRIKARKCDTIDFYCRAFEFMWGAKLSTNQTERKSPCNWDLENLKTVWAAKNLTPPTHG